MKDKVMDAYQAIANSYNSLIDHKPHNAYYDRPNTLNLVGDVNGKLVLDAACGPGKYADILSDNGAIVTGFDLSEEMIKLAEERKIKSAKFFVHDLELPLEGFQNESFDLVLCALALHYIKDWNNTIKEFCRVLKPNGQLIISIEHSFNDYLFFKSKKYFEVELVNCDWRGFGKRVNMTSYRRSLGDCISPITNNGFYIDQLIEPKPVKEMEVIDPKHFKELNNFPAFMCIRAVKR